MSLNQTKSVCVVVPVFNRIENTLKFLESFKKSSYTNYKIFIADDNSSDGTSDILAEKYPDVIIEKGDGNLWWSGGTNLGVKYALANNFDYVLTINNDAVVHGDYLKILVDCAENNAGKIIGSVLLFEGTKKVWSSGGYMDWKVENPFRTFYTGDTFEDLLKKETSPMPAEILNGDGTLFPIEIFRKIGLYDATWFPQYHADSEIILRARKKLGTKAVVCLDATLDNDIIEAPRTKNTKEHIFSKKSVYYWRPMVKIYLSYAPFKYKLYFFKQYQSAFKISVFKSLFKRILGK